MKSFVHFINESRGFKFQKGDKCIYFGGMIEYIGTSVYILDCNQYNNFNEYTIEFRDGTFRRVIEENLKLALDRRPEPPRRQRVRWYHKGKLQEDK